MARPTDKDPRRLLVEGEDDRWSVIRLLERNGINCDKDVTPQMPYIHNATGYVPLLDSLVVSVKSFERLGVIIDADIRPTNRWSQLQGRFRAAGVTLPADPAPSGVIVEGLLPRSNVGVWLMPDNSRPGALEHFLADLVPNGDACWPYAEEATKEAQSRNAPFPSDAFMKARIYTWLAWREEPGLPFGIALTAKYFRCDSRAALAFISWFQRLFF